MTRSQPFPAVASSVGAARRFAAHALVGAPRAILDDIALMVSELATNAVVHALSSFELAVVQTPREIRVELTDLAGGSLALTPHHENGHHGLRIVDRLSTRWGVSAGPEAGKTVWFTLAVPDHSPRRLATAAVSGRADGGRPAREFGPSAA
jgi:sigma-B regulation protein RsbU (phosphoserine phosphatase)